MTGANLKSILYDYREQRSGVPDYLVKLGIEAKAMNLSVDYVIGKNCLVERKTIADFISSIADGRLFRQVSSMAKACSYPVLLLEGGGLYLQDRVPPNAIRGVMIWVTVKQKVAILRTYNAYDTASMLALLVRHYGDDDNRAVVVKHKPVPISQWQRQINMLMQVPGVGRKMAKELLSAFGSVTKMVQVSDVELISLPHIGKERLKAFRQLFPHT